MNFGDLSDEEIKELNRKGIAACNVYLSNLPKATEAIQYDLQQIWANNDSTLKYIYWAHNVKSKDKLHHFYACTNKNELTKLSFCTKEKHTSNNVYSHIFNIADINSVIDKTIDFSYDICPDCIDIIKRLL